jgi:hypothetical protein
MWPARASSTSTSTASDDTAARERLIEALTRVLYDVRVRCGIGARCAAASRR